MKNKKEEKKEYFERNILLVIFVATLGFVLDWLSADLLLDVNPWGTATAIPGLVLTLQGLWLIVHPYVIIYDDRFEIKQSLLYNKEFYYLDIKALGDKKSNAIQLIYNDGDIASISLIGMRASQKVAFKKKLNEKINESIRLRDF